MDKKINTLIIPDVHGREFWINPVKEVLENSDAHIVFLGDYHDPYPYEWEPDIDYTEISYNRFVDIVEMKKANPDRITLLIGNHDCGYCIGDDICSCRMDRVHRRAIEKVFAENHDLFRLAEETTINGKHFIFSHAGILKGWANSVWGEEYVEKNGFNVVNHLNNAWLTDSYGVLDALGAYDRYRGWGGFTYGSPVWSDIRSWVNVKPEETFGFNIVGHSQCNTVPIIFDSIADLDARKAFYLDDEGNIRDYQTDDIQEKTVKPSDDE